MLSYLSFFWHYEDAMRNIFPQQGLVSNYPNMTWALLHILPYSVEEMIEALVSMTQCSLQNAQFQKKKKRKNDPTPNTGSFLFFFFPSKSTRDVLLQFQLKMTDSVTHPGYYPATSVPELMKSDKSDTARALLASWSRHLWENLNSQRRITSALTQYLLNIHNTVCI